MHKVSTVYLTNEPVSLNYRAVRRNISNKWEEKARALQERRWRVLKKLTKDGKL